MALKPCRECKKKVSTEALACPRCGVPNPTLTIKKDKSKKTSGKTGEGGWPVEYLESVEKLHTSYNQKKNLKIQLNGMSIMVKKIKKERLLKKEL